MKIYMIAGEASGDMHGARLVSALKHEQPDIQLVGWGGDQMESAGMQLRKHYRELAFMGFAEVIANLRTILKNLKFCKKDILAENPDALILIDYPGFNMRIAKWAHKKGIKVYYYIAPQAWAWKKNRAYDLKRDVDQLYLILPFEQKFFNEYAVPTTYVGNPLLETIPAPTEGYQTDHHIHRVALLPGSRRQEINKMLPVFLELAQKYPNKQYFIAVAPSIETSFYESFLANYNGDNLTLHTEPMQLLLPEVDMAIVTSGTATLECALHLIPSIICYKGSAISYQIAKRLVTIKYIGLPNLILDKPVFPELIQNDFTLQRLVSEFEKLDQPDDYYNVREQLLDLRQMLEPPNASEIVAQSVLTKLNSTNAHA